MSKTLGNLLEIVKTSLGNMEISKCKTNRVSGETSELKTNINKREF